MAQLYFNYSTMNAGKSTVLLQVAHNYMERGMHVELFTFGGDDRYGVGKITSRIGLQADSNVFNNDTSFTTWLGSIYYDNYPSCILIDESQFLSQRQVMELASIVDNFGIPVMCYGLRTDFQGNLFEGSKALFSLADKFNEMKTICECGKKATHVIRIDENGNTVKRGDTVQIGGNDSYTSLCRRCFTKAFMK